MSSVNLDPAQQHLLDAIRAVEHKLDALADNFGHVRRHGGELHEVVSLASQKSGLLSRTWEEPFIGHSKSMKEAAGLSDAAPHFGHTVSMMNRRRSNSSSMDLVEMQPGGRRRCKVGGTGDLMCLAIRPGFEPRRQPRSSRESSKPSTRQRQSRISSVDSDVEMPEAGCQAWNPDSASRTVFEVTSMFMLLYDAFIVPYGLAWDISTETPFFQVAIWITRVFWTTDLLLNGVTGYRDQDAKLIRDIPSSVKHYASSWFLPDLILVTCDWLTISNVFGGGQRFIAWMRVMRLVRSGRQILRGWTLVMKAKLRIQEKAFHLMMDIALLMLMILWVNHVVCCIWYSIGAYTTSDTGDTWLLDNGIATGGQYYDYLTALHWAITQMTPGSMEVTPKSSGERLFNVCVLLLGLLMGSSLVATLTSMMTQYKLRVEGASKKLLFLHQYLVQQGADAQLALAIKMQVRARSTETVRLKPKDVEYLSLLSTHLQDALWHSWCMQQLSVHPLLVSLPLVDATAMTALSKTAMKTVELPPGDAVFEEGAIGEYMYFVVLGTFHYSPGDFAPEASMPDSDSQLQLKAGVWCCEPALWTIWTHLGTLESVTVAEVLALSAVSLQNTLAKYPTLFNIVSDYCSAFHKYINEPGVHKSDLNHGLDIFEVISSLSTDVRNQLAAPVIQSMETRFMQNFMSKAKLELLKQEVHNGECEVGLVGKEVVRNTFVVALRISQAHDPDRFLVQVGSVIRDTGKLDVSCLLPGLKRKWRENYTSAVTRLLSSELVEIMSEMDTHFTEGSERTVSFKQSPTYNIRTRYLKTTFKSTIAPNTPLKILSADKAKVPHPKGPGALSWLFRPESRRTAAVEKEAAEVLAAHRTVVVLKCDDFKRTSKKLYLWLLPREYEVLTQPAAQPIVEEWLLSIKDDLGTETFVVHPPSADSTMALETTVEGNRSESEYSEISRLSF